MRYYYDLHLHSCLSPCADDESTPNSIAGIAALSGLNIIALTDHNTCKNCKAFFEACERYGVIPVAGMELTTSEDIHVVCLFERLEDAIRFDSEVSLARTLIRNKPTIFGEQPIMDSEDNVLGYEEYLLSNATRISIEDAPSLVSKFGGVAYPAHIDRESNGMIAILGTFPATPYFTAYELRDSANLSDYSERYALGGKRAIVSSDAHSLECIRDAECFVELDASPENPDEVRRKLIDYLRSCDEGAIT